MNLKNAVIAASICFFIFCGGPELMIEQDTQPQITADPEMATLIIYRGTSFGSAIEIDNFIDKKFIGQTQGKSYFISRIDPGTHYLIGDAENNACARITIEAGKIYYIMQGIYPGIMSARTGFSASNPEDFTKDQKEGMDFIVYAPPPKTDDIPAIEDDEYKETTEDFEKEVVEDPSRHKDILELKGY